MKLKLPIGTIVRVTAFIKRPKDRDTRSWKPRAMIVGSTGGQALWAKLVPVDPEFMELCAQTPGEMRRWRKEPFIYRRWDKLIPV